VRIWLRNAIRDRHCGYRPARRSLALLRLVIPGVFDFNLGGPYGNVIRIVCWAVAAIVILLILWKFLACAGLLNIGRYGALYGVLPT
jgi:hypothetical protein